MQGAIERSVADEHRRGGGLRAFGRSVLAVVAGALTAGLTISLVEGISSMIYPLPPGLDVNDYEAMRQHIGTLPVGAFVLVLVAWAVGTFAGSWVAARLASRAQLVHGLIVGALFLLAGIANLLMIPHPTWMWAGGILAFVVCSYLGARAATAHSSESTFSTAV